MKRGFTLIELMIVIAIVGILATVAIPKFADVSKKAREAATLANLSAMRSAISIYHADTDGLWPWVFDTKERWIDGKLYPAFIPKYMDRVPCAKLPKHEEKSVVEYTDKDIDKINHDYGGWIYQMGTGKFRINCTCYNLARTKRYCDY
jgi:prepilin-type N-terminal cleavage/methylation domain-containing protein